MLGVMKIQIRNPCREQGPNNARVELIGAPVGCDVRLVR
jgi:hypothetical protein